MDAPLSGLSGPIFTVSDYKCNLPEFPPLSGIFVKKGSAAKGFIQNLSNIVFKKYRFSLTFEASPFSQTYEVYSLQKDIDRRLLILQQGGYL
jgi:hypothetical protein